jgi:hypothetical protein
MPFTPEEQQLATRLSVVGGWDKIEAGSLKTKLKTHFLTKTCHCCCYCLRSMYQWHSITIDVEHVLPKGSGKFPQFTFEVRNLSVACKRCNMGIKGSDTSFYLGATNDPNPFRSELYEFIHPNLDTASQHLEFWSAQHNAKFMVKYQVLNDSTKGKATYEYFKLQRLEVNSFDEAQGLSAVLPDESIAPEITREILKAVEALEDN